LLETEHRIRSGAAINADACGVDPYWADLIRLLQIFAASGDEDRVDALKAAMAFKRYGPYVDSRKKMGVRAPDASIATPETLIAERA
jgi:thymidylate synthase